MRLLQIIVDGNCDLAVRQVASIHFKNFIAENWAPHDPGNYPLKYTSLHFGQWIICLGDYSVCKLQGLIYLLINLWCRGTIQGFAGWQRVGEAEHSCFCGTSSHIVEVKIRYVALAIFSIALCFSPFFMKCQHFCLQGTVGWVSQDNYTCGLSWAMARSFAVGDT